MYLSLLRYSPSFLYHLSRSKTSTGGMSGVGPSRKLALEFFHVEWVHSAGGALHLLLYIACGHRCWFIGSCHLHVWKSSHLDLDWTESVDLIWLPSSIDRRVALRCLDRSQLRPMIELSVLTDAWRSPCKADPAGSLAAMHETTRQISTGAPLEPRQPIGFSRPTVGSMQHAA